MPRLKSWVRIPSPAPISPLYSIPFLAVFQHLFKCPFFREHTLNMPSKYFKTRGKRGERLCGVKTPASQKPISVTASGVWTAVLSGYSDVQKSMNKRDPIGRLVWGIRRKKRCRDSSTLKIRIVLESLAIFVSHSSLTAPNTSPSATIKVSPCGIANIRLKAVLSVQGWVKNIADV